MVLHQTFSLRARVNERNEKSAPSLVAQALYIPNPPEIRGLSLVAHSLTKVQTVLHHMAAEKQSGETIAGGVCSLVSRSQTDFAQAIFMILSTSSSCA